jgi:hypothetical protein
MTARSRGASRPSSAIAVPSSKSERARGMPDAGRTHGPPAKKMQAAGTTGSAETTGIPRATVLTLISCSPRCTGLVGHRCPRDAKHHHGRDTSVGVSGPHDFTSAGPRSSHAPKRPSHPRLTCRDDRAQHPSARGGMGGVCARLPKNERKIFFAEGLDSTDGLERMDENNPCAHVIPRPDQRADRQGERIRRHSGAHCASIALHDQNQLARTSWHYRPRNAASVLS